jgi:hypothetical protein
VVHTSPDFKREAANRNIATIAAKTPLEVIVRSLCFSGRTIASGFQSGSIRVFRSRPAII